MASWEAHRPLETVRVHPRSSGNNLAIHHWQLSLDTLTEPILSASLLRKDRVLE